MTDRWKPLPCEGGTLLELQFVGNGKDSELTIHTAEHPAIVVPLSGARWDLSSTVPLTTEMQGHGDTAVRLELRPAGGLPATLAEARVVPWSDDEELRTSVVGSRVELLDCLPLRIAITPSDPRSS